MKKVLFVLSIAAGSLTVNAQTGKNQLSIGPEVGLSTSSDGGTAFGGTAKYMHGIGKAGQITLTTGVALTSEEEGGVKSTVTQIPVLVGYRHYFSGFFVEPQAGYTNTGLKITESGEELLNASSGSFGYAVGGGYSLPQGLDLGVSYRNIAESGAKGSIVFRVGWNFNLGGAK